LAKLAKELDEANYVLEIPVFKQFHKLVVGKGGANIKKVYFILLFFLLIILINIPIELIQLFLD